MNVVTHSKSLEEPHFTFVNTGEKTYEIRLDTEKNKRIQVGDQIIFENYEQGFYREVTVRVVEKEIFGTFEEALTDKGFKKCVPSAKDMKEAVKIYNDLYTGIRTPDSKILCWKIQVLRE